MEKLKKTHKIYFFIIGPGMQIREQNILKINIYKVEIK